MVDWLDDDYRKRSLGERDKKLLYRNAKGKCQNPACGKEIEFDEMQVGHKNKAFSKGGATTFKNSVCLCWRCNNLQGTDSWATFLKKQGIEDEGKKKRKALDTLNINQLKFLAKKHHVKVKGSVSEGFLEDTVSAPSKKKYVKALAKVVPEEMIDSELKEMPEPVKKKRKRSSSDDSWF